jgi:CDP-glucose 4,6-dehydratase
MGTALVSQLADEGASVFALARGSAEPTNAGVERVRGDVQDAAGMVDIVKELDISAVFHLAAQAIVVKAAQDPMTTFETNIRGTWNVLEACREAPAVDAVVVASSDKAYGPSTQLPYTEDQPVAGRNAYDVSKACADLVALAYHASFDLPVAVTRCANLFGPGDRNWSRIVPGTIRAVLHGERPVVRSDGSMVRDYIYVDDAADAYLTVAEALLDGRDGVAGEAFNFSLETPLTVLQVVDTIIRMMGSDITPDVLGGTLTNEITRQFMSSAKARARLGWRPRIGFEAGLRQTIAWYRTELA